MKVAIIGGGISGLTAAYRLKQLAMESGAPIDIQLFESSSRLGGTVSTEDYQGCVIENGPDAFITTKPEGLKLSRSLNIEHRLIETNKEFRRAFIAFRKRLHPMPEGFIMIAPGQILPLVTSGLFSPAGKLRIMMDVLLPAAEVEDESLASFVRRRLGKEALERVAQPMLAGVYTADPERLSLRSTMPQFLEYEQKYGSVIVGVQEEIKARAAKAKSSPTSKAGSGKVDGGARYSMFVSFDRGMSVLTDCLAANVGRECIRLNARISKLHKQGSKWNLHLSASEILSFDAVVVATPPGVAAQLLSETAPEVATPLAEQEQASSAVLNLVFKRKDIPNKLDGFGFVVPAVEKRNIIACSYSSIKFPDRAPADMATLRVFLGGALQPGQVLLGDYECLSSAQKDLRHYLGIKADPVWHNLTRWIDAMPQYHVGHQAKMKSLNESICAQPGLFLAGNAYCGVGIPDCIGSGETAAARALSFLTGATPCSQPL